MKHPFKPCRQWTHQDDITIDDAPDHLSRKFDSIDDLGSSLWPGHDHTVGFEKSLSEDVSYFDFVYRDRDHNDRPSISIEVTQDVPTIPPLDEDQSFCRRNFDIHYSSDDQAWHVDYFDRWIDQTIGYMLGMTFDRYHMNRMTEAKTFFWDRWDDYLDRVVYNFELSLNPRHQKSFDLAVRRGAFLDRWRISIDNDLTFEERSNCHPLSHYIFEDKRLWSQSFLREVIRHTL